MRRQVPALGRRIAVFAVTVGAMIGGCAPPGPSEGNVNDNTSGAPTDRIGSGTARISGVVYSAHADPVIPLGGAILMLGDAVALAKVNGAFELFGVPAGRQPFLIDGSHLVVGDGRYGQFTSRLDIVDGEQRLLDQPVYLPFIPFARQTKVEPERPISLSTERGATWTIPAGAARRGGTEYDGWLAVVEVPLDRAPIPLPDEIRNAARSLMTLQPIDVAFPAGLAPRFVDDAPRDTPEDVFQSLRMLNPSTGGFDDTVILRRTSRKWEPIAGRVRQAGWFLHGGEIVVQAFMPCGDENTLCSTAWADAGQRLQTLREGTVAGARATLNRLARAMLDHQRNTDGARALVAAALEDYRTCRANVTAMSATFQRLDEAEAVRRSIEDAVSICTADDACGGEDAQADLLSARAAQAAIVVTTHMAEYLPRFDRLAHSLDALSPYFDGITVIDGTTLKAFEDGVLEVLKNIMAFDPLKSPADANDVLLNHLAAAADAIDASRSAYREPVTTMSERPVEVIQVGRDQGTRSRGAVIGGRASMLLLDTPAETRIYAVDPHSGQCSAPQTVSAWLAAGLPPNLTLDRRRVERAMVAGQPNAGELSAQTPMHRLRVSAAEREGAEVLFVGDAGVWIGLAGEGEPPAFTSSEGFHVTNLPRGGRYDLLAIAGESAAAARYYVQLAPDPQRFDFGKPIEGAFDLFRRAEVVFFDASAGETALVDVRCCGTSGPAFDATVFDASGRRLEADPRPGESGADLLAFRVVQTGLHRLVLKPDHSAFGEYRVVLTRLPAPDVRDIALGQDVSLTFTAPQRTVVLRFPGQVGQTVDLVAVASEGLDRLDVRVETIDGRAAVERAALYFDGSSFSRIRWVFHETATYEAALRADHAGDLDAGSCVVRIEPVSAAP